MGTDRRTNQMDVEIIRRVDMTDFHIHKFPGPWQLRRQEMTPQSVRYRAW